MAGFSWGGMVESLKAADFQGVVSQTQQGLEQLKQTARSAAADVQAESDAIRAEKQVDGKVHLMPWEVEDESKAILQEDLMQRVMNLSLDDANFTEPPDASPFDFSLERHVDVIMKLLQLDPNLATRHTRMSPTMDERVFWRNYFHRCQRLRAEVLDGVPLPPPRASVGGDSSGSASGGDGSSTPEEQEQAARAKLEEAAAEAALEAEVTAELEEDNFALDEVAHELDELADGELDEELEAQIAAELGDEELGELGDEELGELEEEATAEESGESDGVLVEKEPPA